MVIEEEPRTGPADVSRTLTDAMERAGVHPAYVHAVRVCGFVLTEENQATLTTDQVDRWNAALDGWLREVAPSPALRRWFGHEPSRWEGFRHRYAAELDTLADHWRPLAERAAHHRVTLLYAARDEEHNHALALKNYLDTWLRAHGPR